MNSSLQILYMNPLFRQIVYALPLCIDEDISKPSEFVKGQKHEILLSLQKLFIQLQHGNIYSISTRELTESFKWNHSEGAYQQDSQEFIRLLLFETLDRILQPTPFDGVVNSFFKITYTELKICSNCGKTNDNEAFDYVLPLMTQYLPNLEHSLDNFFDTAEVISDYQCHNCNQRVDLKKLNKIKQLPILLNFGLNKFTWDMETGERIKLSDKYEFPLEINMKKYIQDDSINSDDDYIYSLHGIIIHSGTPYSGHYFAYCRDLCDEGNWNLQKLEEFKKEPYLMEDKAKIIDEKVKESENQTETKSEQVEEQPKTKGGKKKGKEGQQGKVKKKGTNEGNGGNNKSKQNQQGKKGKKAKKENEDEYRKLNFDECDFPLEYNDKTLANKWFEFNDSVVTPIRIGRLAKQFQSSQSAYMLFYMKKTAVVNKCTPPLYLEKYITEYNQTLFNQRETYEDELKSLTLTVFSDDNFYFDEFGILSSHETDLSKLSNQIPLKFKFYNKLQDVLNEIKSKFNLQTTEEINLYEFSFNKSSNSLTVLNKFNSSQKEETLETLKICHNSYFLLTKQIDTVHLDNQVGHMFEPISIRIIYGTTLDKVIRIFHTLTLEEFKSYLRTFFGIQHDISLLYRSANKNIYLDKIGWDKKNNCWLNLKQLRLQEKNVIYITKLEDALEELGEEDEINCIVKLEDEDENFTLVKIPLKKTFNDLIKEIETQCGLKTEENEKISFRLRKEMDGKIIYKNMYENKLHTDEMFVEGGVRLRVEFGEEYEFHEILLRISLKLEKQKVTKQFIGNPDKILISELKNFICQQFNLKGEEHMFYKVSCFGDPIKAIKNENQLISKSGLKDNDTICLKNISNELYESYYVKIYPNLESDVDFVFQPIQEESFCLDLNLPKETTLQGIKQMIIENLNLEILESKCRLRVLGKRTEIERILRGKSLPIKKFNIENPGKLLFEVLDTEEDLKDNQIQLYLWTRNVQDKSYTNKRSVVFEFTNGVASADQLYELCREVTGGKNISIAKYSKGFYEWESIPEMNEEGTVNLRKGPYNIRDGDWIGIRSEDDNKDGKDDFQTKEDCEKKKLQAEENKTKRPKRNEERTLRITLDD